MAWLAASSSIRQHLLTYLLTGAAATAVLIYLVVQSIAAQLARESQDNILTASALSIVDSSRVRNGEITVDIPYFAFSMLGSASDERLFYAIWLGDEFLSGYEDLPRPSADLEEARVTATYRGEGVRIVTARRATSLLEGASVLEVSIAQTLKGQRATLARVSRMAVGIGAGFFALTALLALVVANFTIRPVNRLASSVSRRGPSDLRPVTTEVPSEMVPLVSALNSFMTRLQVSLARSEDFIAEAAHRVRTPLALVRTQTEIFLRRADSEEDRRTSREMLRAIDETSRTAGQLLDHAMVSFRSDSLEDETIPLPALVRDAVERVRPISDLKDIEITVSAPRDASLKGDPILLQSALANILDNAVKYTASEGQVDVRVNLNDQSVTLTIADTGAGFPDPGTEDLTARFVRGSNASDVVGSGLGLTIADEVVRVHGGTLALSNTDEGGACVTLSFPL